MHAIRRTTMESNEVPKPLACLQRLREALNRRDLEAMAACFDPDYKSQFPAHPERAFQGQGSMRQNWSQIFATVPNLNCELKAWSIDGETIWSEWEWTGTRLDGLPFFFKGVTIQGIPEDRIAWVRMYMEPVQYTDSNTNAVQRELTKTSG